MTALNKVVRLPTGKEGELRKLFREEDELLESLAENRLSQKAARRDYATAHGLLCLPSFETLRKVLGA